MSAIFLLGAIGFIENVKQTFQVVPNENGEPVVSFSCGVSRGAAKIEVPVDEWPAFVEALKEGAVTARTAADHVRRTFAEVKEEEKDKEGKVISTTETVQFKVTDAKNARTGVVPKSDFPDMITLFDRASKAIPIAAEKIRKEVAEIRAKEAAEKAAKEAEEAAKLAANAPTEQSGDANTDTSTVPPTDSTGEQNAEQTTT